MNLAETMKELESLGTEQNRKVYRRHGAGDNLFGVSFANLGKLQKRIKKDHALACALWKTGNADARALATMIADPMLMTGRDCDDWLRSVRCYGQVNLFAERVVGLSPHARKKMLEWIESPDEFIGQAGWVLMGAAMAQAPDPGDAWAEKMIDRIERTIHSAPNRTRYAMNMALIAIAMRNDRIERLAIDAAGRIGKVEVDHGETGCKTPDAADYIRKIKAYRSRKGSAGNGKGTAAKAGSGAKKVPSSPHAALRSAARAKVTAAAKPTKKKPAKRR